MSIIDYRKGLTSFYFVVLSLIFITACQDGEKEELVKKNEFVAAYTSGQISSTSQIRVVLNLPEEIGNISSHEPHVSVFQLKPHVKGKVYWGDQSTLIFDPDEPMENGQKYKAILDLEKLLGTNDEELKVFAFYFEVFPLSFIVELDGIDAYNFSSPEWNILRGRISASDAVDEQKLNNLLTAEQSDKSLHVSVSEKLPNNKYNFRIDSIERLEVNSVVTIKWNGKDEVLGFDENSELTYTVPSINRFDLIRVNTSNEGDQYIQLEFSDPVNPGQNLDGLIYFQDGSNSRLSIEGNKILLYPSQQLVGSKTLVIKKEVKSRNKKQLPNDVIQNIFFGQLKPAVKFTASGTIMPGEKGWFLQFEAVNLNAVDVLISEIHANNIQQFLQVNRLAGDYQLNRVGKLVHRQKIDLQVDLKNGGSQWSSYALDLSKMINKDPGAIYRVELRFRKNYALYECRTEIIQEEETVSESYYTSDYYYPPGYNWRERENPCHVSYYRSERFVSKNVMASNIGLTVKEDGDRFLVYANDLVSTEPIDGVKISLFNYQQHEIANANTNSNGVAGMKYVGSPYLLVAEKDGQFSYQRVDGGSALSYSRFQTSGVNVDKGLKGFIYGERGVWRPGDTIFLTLIIDDRENPLPKGHPVTMKLTNPNRKEMSRKTSIKGVNGLYTFAMLTGSDDLTGLWEATAEVGGATFSKTLRIETIKPNRLKIDLNFNKSILTTGKNTSVMKVRWLHGGIAANLKADVNITIRPAKTIFKGFESFNFDDPARYFRPEDLTVFDGKLNANGNATITFELPPADFAPGMLKVNFASKAYEQGGDFSIHQTSMVYSPFERFIGISGPNKESDYLEVDTDQEFEVASVSSVGKPVSIENLEVEVYKLDWSWWYSSNRRNLGSYISSNYNRKVLSKTISTKNGNGKFDFKIDYPSWGWYYIQVRDAEGGHQTGKKIYLDWPSSYSRENREAPGGQSLLSLSTDKEKYKLGEEIKVSVPTPANSRLLIALEKGDKQLKSWQMNAEGEETVISFEATAEMTPNVYLYVSVLQPHAQTVNDLPIRMYGVLPVMVEDENTVLKPRIDLPESVRPGETYKVKVSETSNKSMTYTIAIVDDGLLNLTNFRTPIPHKYFYAKEALALKSWDIYSDVMGAFGGRIEKVFSIGGDMESDGDSDKKKANRFKPVVSFLGPFQLKAGAENAHSLKMPNYVGSVRCMVIAGENGAYGHIQKSMTVKQPLMVLATLPRILAPGEVLKLPVSVFVMDEQIKNVTLEIETNEFLSPKASTSKLSINEVGEHMAYFDLTVTQKEGIAKIRVKAISGEETASYDMELQVRNPNPLEYQIAHHLVKAGDKLEIEPEMFGMEETNTVSLTVSGMPPLNLEKRLSYLIRYPYGCVEQTTSSVFPQLYLDRFVDMTEEMKSRVESNIRSGIDRLSKFQQSSGGFSYWQGTGGATDWGTSYAGHFLLLAKEKGYFVSTSLINSWIRYQKQASNNWAFKESTALNQAYRLYTLALAGEPNLSAMNRLRELKTLNTSARFRLAAAYALTGQKEVAKKLIENEIYEPASTANYWRWSYGSVIRDQAMMLETYLLIDDMNEALSIFNSVADGLKSNGWMSTQTTAFALYSASLFVNEGDQDEEYRFKYLWNSNTSAEMRSKSPIYTVDLSPGRNNKLEVENISAKNLFVTTTISGIPLLDKPTAYQNNFILEVNYFDMNGDTIDVSNIKHGTDFYVRATIKNPTKNGNLDNIALTQIFPSGWEIINTRMLDVAGSLKSDKSDYVDFRDDRVNTFFDLKAGKSKSFIVLLNAAYQGKYFLPSTTCGPMYNNEISAGAGGGWVSVIK